MNGTSNLVPRSLVDEAALKRSGYEITVPDTNFTDLI